MSPSLGRCWFVLLVFVCHPPSSFFLSFFLLIISSFFSIVLTGLTSAANNTCGQQNQVLMNYANPQSIYWATLSLFIHRQTHPKIFFGGGVLFSLFCMLVFDRSCALGHPSAAARQLHFWVPCKNWSGQSVEFDRPRMARNLSNYRQIF